MTEKPQNNMVKIEDDAEVFEELLRFLYAGKVKKSSMETLAVKLLIAADKYDVEGLKTMCEGTLSRSLSITNAVEYLLIAELCSADLLKKSVNFIASNMKKMRVRPEFKSLRMKYPSVMDEILDASAARRKN